MTTHTGEASLEITTNGRAREMMCLYDLPLKAQLDFDYLRERSEGHEYRLVYYKGAWHDVFDTQRIEVGELHSHPCGFALYVPEESPLAKWDSISSDTYFSGTLFRLFGRDLVVCGQYFSRG